MIMVSKQRNTYADWSSEIGLLENKTITKQSLNNRITLETECFIREIVSHQLSERTKPLQTKKVKGVLKYFNNVMIDDSTTIHLPDELAEVFPGNVTRGKRRALAKIHAMYNLTQNNFPFLNIHDYSNNDQSLSAAVLPYLNRGDLCIRDLGFLTLDVVGEMIKKDVSYLSRKSFSTKIYDSKTGTEINLVKELRKHKFIDKEVLIGQKHQLKVRLIAHKMPDSKANERIRKAKENPDKRANHSLEYYKLLAFNIYITNISLVQCSIENLLSLYKLRWNIEIIFKSWKSCFSLEKLIHHQCTNAIRVKCIIYLMLLYIYMFQVVWLKYCESKIKTENPKVELSLLKMANFFRKHFTEIIGNYFERNLMQQIKVHCCYDDRQDRDNARKLILKFAA